jgi:flagellar secretion chaperone FliS
MSVRDQYLEQKVNSASPEGLLILLVDGAANFIRRALVELELGKMDEVHNCLVKAQNIYIELVISLNLDAGDFADNLAQVYQYLYNLLIEANLDKDKDKISQALRLADEIRDLWKDAVERSRSEFAEAAPVVPEPAFAGKPVAIGLYEPSNDTGIIRPGMESSDHPPRLNITG